MRGLICNFLKKNYPLTESTTCKIDDEIVSLSHEKWQIAIYYV